MRTRPTGTTQITPNWGTSSGFDPGQDFEEPKDITDVTTLETEIPRGSRSPASSAGTGLPSRSPGSGIDLEKPGGRSPFGGLDAKPVGRSPIGLEAGKSAGGGLNVTASVPVGGPISARGGVNIGKDGAIKGAQVGVGIGAGPIGASIDVGVDNSGCFRYVTVAFGPFSHTYGQNVCESKGKKPTSSEPTEKIPLGYDSSELLALLVNNKRYSCLTLDIGYIDTLTFTQPHSQALITALNPPRTLWISNGTFVSTSRSFGENLLNYNFKKHTIEKNIYGQWIQKEAAVLDAEVDLGGDGVFSPFPIATFTYNNKVSGNNRKQHWPYYNNIGITTGLSIKNYVSYWKGQSPILLSIIEIPATATEEPKLLTPSGAIPISQLNPPTNEPSFSPIPNPQPRKMNDNCCEVLIALQLETLRMLGRQVGPKGLMPVSRSKGFLGEEIERTATPIDPQDPDKKIKISFSTFYELANYLLQQQISLDTAFDPQSYKRPQDGSKLQNPKYNRDSEESLTTNVQPKTDKLGNERELEIGKDVFILSALDQQKYIFESLKRLEYLFPFGELSDAQIDKELLIPRKKGDQSPKQNIKIHNMIHAYEIQMQYLNAILGNPREGIFLKDVDPSKEGDQEFSFNAMSLSHLVRELFKFQLDTSGDVDMTRESAIRSLRTNLANRIQIVQIAEMVQALFEDSGMIEDQDWIELPLEGDPYAGHWKQGQGFQPSAKLDSHKEEDIEELGRATNKNFVAKVKVLRRDKREKTDMRDLIRGLADFMQRLASNPAADLDKMFENAKFKVQTEMALIRANVAKAATVARNRTRKKKK